MSAAYAVLGLLLLIAVLFLGRRRAPQEYVRREPTLGPSAPLPFEPREPPNAKRDPAGPQG